MFFQSNERSHISGVDKSPPTIIKIRQPKGSLPELRPPPIPVETDTGPIPALFEHPYTASYQRVTNGTKEAPGGPQQTPYCRA